MAKSVGSRWYSIDFHVHTPDSLDYKDPRAKPEDIVDASIKKGLDAILVSDHNNIGWVDQLRTAAKDKPLTIFPGFEINAQGGHILALFDPNASIDIIYTALIEAGIKKPDWGKLDVVGYDLETVFKAIASNGRTSLLRHMPMEKKAF